MANTAALHSVVTEFPPELRTPMWHFIEALEERLLIPHQDFVELRQSVERLAEAQERTEQRLDRLTAAQEELSEAQKQTEQRLDRLAAAQEKTEQRLDRLAAAQEKTEQRLDRLAAAQEKTEQTVQQLVGAIERLEKTISDRFGEIGSRWGLYTETAFRGAIRRIVRNLEGVTVKEGWYGNRQVDVVIRNGEHILLEITSRMSAKDIDQLYASADDYRAKKGVEPTLMVATSYISPNLMQKIVNLPRPIEIFSYEEEEIQD